MAEVVETAGLKRQKGYLYFVRGTDVFKQPAGRGVSGQAQEVYKGTFEREDGYMYFLNAEGHIARARRSVGGKKPAAKKPAAKKPAARRT